MTESFFPELIPATMETITKQVDETSLGPDYQVLRPYIMEVLRVAFQPTYSDMFEPQSKNIWIVKSPTIQLWSPNGPVLSVNTVPIAELPKGLRTSAKLDRMMEEALENLSGIIEKNQKSGVSTVFYRPLYNQYTTLSSRFTTFKFNIELPQNRGDII